MHYQSLTAALEQYSGSLTHHPASPDSLALHIDRQTQGCLKLHTPDGISLSLTCRDEPVFWSFHSHDLYDVYLVRSYAESWQAYQPVGHIGSRVNEHIARQPAAEQGLLWNKFFIEQLAAHNAGLLGIGEWHFDYRPAQTLPQRWGECWHETAVGQPETDENYAQWLFSGSRFDALDNDFYTQAERFIALKTHHAEDGRLKYWRKRVRQNQLPPVLVYELTALSDRWPILDGHLRLAAALAEGQLPPLIIIQATTARHSPQTAAEHETAKAAALSQYEKIARQTDHNPQALNAVSQRIVHAFDTRPYLLHTTRAAADITPKTWLQQLQTYAAQHGFAEEFERVWTTESWPMKRVAAFQVV
ncbi:hypothetical protein HMPREF3107_00410 [Neisseria sp. HMSC31F04]|uniref:hypothetical protein n=1 Tax=Neisseria sp. HMSC31F04 TaxID=1581075 RepID=UPI0008A18BDE|nr:hypothetical protein [Neisseria sp. HMSC31F04]OFT04417.1 hypothetical protein HMPREF3107_00410 [Neisseria sp. HMSC31F04]